MITDNTERDYVLRQICPATLSRHIGVAMRARGTDEEFWSDFESLMALQHQIDMREPAAWYEFEKAVAALEERNPKTRNHTYMGNKLTEFLLRELVRRQKPTRYSHTEFNVVVMKFVLLFEKPLIAASSACMVLDNAPNLTEALEECIQFSVVTMGAKFSRVTIVPE